MVHRLCTRSIRCLFPPNCGLFRQGLCEDRVQDGPASGKRAPRVSACQYCRRLLECITRVSRMAFPQSLLRKNGDRAPCISHSPAESTQKREKETGVQFGETYFSFRICQRKLPHKCFSITIKTRLFSNFRGRFRRENMFSQMRLSFYHTGRLAGQSI